jgi:hypothetical protein
MSTEWDAKLAEIRRLNDEFRTSFIGGRVVVTLGIRALGNARMARVLQAIRSFDRFDKGNDPYHEHDFGSLEDLGKRIFWKIDYYNNKMDQGSPDPADRSITVRVLTIMLAEEY